MISPSAEVALVFDGRDSTGESPSWCEVEQALYWIDIEAPALHRLDPATGQYDSWQMPAEIGAFALCESGDVIVALRTGLAKVNLRTSDFSALSTPGHNPLTHRFNDGKCDARGRFWVGTMFDPLSRPAPRREPTDSEPLSVFTYRSEIAPSVARAIIPNGIAWSPDWRTMYFSDSSARTVWAFDFEVESGTLSSQRIFAQFSAADGKPDGAAVDVEGFYWCALYGGGRVVRISPEGALAEEIRLPVSQPTMCAFGDEDYMALYITSAAHGVSLESEPLAGAVLCCRPGVKGLAPALFDDG